MSEEEDRLKREKKMDELQLNLDRVDFEDFTEKLFIFLQEKSLLDPVITKDGAVISKVLYSRYNHNEDGNFNRHAYSVLCILPIRWEYAINPLLWTILIFETGFTCGTLTDVHEYWLTEESLIGAASLKSIILDFIEEYMEKTQGVSNIYL